MTVRRGNIADKADDNMSTTKWNITKTIITLMASAIAGLFSWDMNLQMQLNNESTQHSEFVKKLYIEQKAQSDSLEFKLNKLKQLINE